MFKFLFDFLFPRYCYFCGEEGRYICNSCIKVYVRVNWEQMCYICGKRCSKGFIHSECEGQGYLDGVIYFTFYDKKIREIIKDIKYNFQFDILNEVGEIMSEYFKIYTFPKDIILCDVPLHKRKKRFRGFNQSEVLSKYISKYLKLSYCKFLDRVEDTVSQVSLSREEREANLINAFSLRKNPVGLNILLIDDVFTTGATLNQCAKVLKNQGAKKVYGYVFAKSRE